MALLRLYPRYGYHPENRIAEGSGILGTCDWNF
jgi:hypothetical protein